MSFTNQVVLVTGAASGIGRALSLHLASKGALLGLVDRNAALLEQLYQDLTSAGVRCDRAIADVRSRSQLGAAVKALAARLGPVDILIPCAGISGISLVDDLMVEQLEEILQVNFLGTVYAIEAVLPEMLGRGRGQIVGISSLAAVRAIPFESAYCASKAALAAYLESLRPALRRRGIRVTTIFPGFVRTPLLNNLLAITGAPTPHGLIEVDRAARRIARAIDSGYRIYCFPRSTTWLAYASRWLPAAVYDWVMTRVASRIPLPY